MNPFSQIYLAYLGFKNNLDYPLRQRLGWRSSPVIRSYPDNREILDSYSAKDRLPVQQLLSRLDDQFHFQYFRETHSLDESRENYYYLAMLDEAFQRSGIEFPDSIQAADIGPSSWFYVHALAAVLGWYDAIQHRNYQLTGFEVDAYRLYADFHTRKDHALGNMLGLQNVEFRDHGFEQQPNTYDLVSMFFPFVFVSDHLKWGLPQRLFNPAFLIKSAWNSLKPGGMLLIVNQGTDEHTAELSMLDKLSIPVTTSFKVEPLLYTYPLERYIITAIHAD
jgi:SAM-dependent methyltransferase